MLTYLRSICIQQLHHNLADREDLAVPGGFERRFAAVVIFIDSPTNSYFFKVFYSFGYVPRTLSYDI